MVSALELAGYGQRQAPRAEVGLRQPGPGAGCEARRLVTRRHDAAREWGGDVVTPGGLGGALAQFCAPVFLSLGDRSNRSQSHSYILASLQESTRNLPVLA